MEKGPRLNKADTKLWKGKRLLLLRYYYNLSQQELADQTGLSKQSISKYENGDMPPGRLVMLGFCSFFGVPNDFFLKDNVLIRCTGQDLRFINEPEIKPQEEIIVPRYKSVYKNQKGVSFLGHWDRFDLYYDTVKRALIGVYANRRRFYASPGDSIEDYPELYKEIERRAKEKGLIKPYF